MNKKEVAAALQCSTRQVEKYVTQKRLRVVEYVRGKTGREGVYDADEVARLKDELERERGEVIGQPSPVSALTKPAAQLPATIPADLPAMLGEHLARALSPYLADITRAIREAQTTPAAPAAWLTIDGAAAWLGLPRAAIVRALRDDAANGERRIRVTGSRRGQRVSAADVRDYFEGVKT